MKAARGISACSLSWEKSGTARERKWLRSSPRGARYLINGEPTESKVALGSKGILRYEIVATGKMAHSAYPELGESAIEKLLDALEAIRRMPLPEDPVLGKTTLNIGTISGGRAPNIIPDAAKAELAIRLVSDGRKVDQALRAAIGDRAEVKEILTLPAMHFAALDGFPTSVVAFTTDIPVLAPAWGEPFLFGPGSIHVAHTTRRKNFQARIACRRRYLRANDPDASGPRGGAPCLRILPSSDTEKWAG